MKVLCFLVLLLSPIFGIASVDLSNIIDATKQYKIGYEIDSKFDYVLPLIDRNTKKGQYDALSFWWKNPEPTDSYISCKLWYEGENTIEYLSLGLSTYDKIDGKNLDGMHMLVGHALPGGATGTGSLMERIYPNLQTDIVEREPISISDMNVTTTGREVNLLQHENVVQNVILNFMLPLDFFSSQNILINGENFFVFQSEDFSGVFRLNFDDVRNEAQGYSLDGIMVEDCRSDHFGYDYRMNMKMRTKLYWKVENEYVNIMMKHKGFAWLAWGVAKDDDGQMVGSEVAIAKWADGTLSEGTIKKYSLEGTSKSMIQEMDKTHQTLEHFSLSQQGGETIVRFSKLLKEKGEHTIFADRPNTFVYAVGIDNAFSQHAYAESFRIELNKCPYVDNDLEIMSRKGYKTFVAHGVFGAVAFAFLVPFAIGSAWFREILPDSWFKYHVYANVVAGCLTLLSFLIAYIQTSLNKGAHFSEAHHRVGLALFILVLIQIISGLTRITSDRKRIPSELISDSRYFSLRERWDALHKAFGLSILIIGLIQVGTGFNMIAKEYGTRNSTSRYITYVVLMSITMIAMRSWILRGTNSSVINSENDLELTGQAEGSFVNNSAGNRSPRVAVHTPLPNEII
jgi:uncharacterized membrane protein